MGKKTLFWVGMRFVSAAKLALISDLGIKQNLLVSVPLRRLQSYTMSSTEHLFYTEFLSWLIPD